MFAAFEKAVRFATRLLNGMGMWLLFGVMLMVSIDTIVRYFFSRPIKGSFELSEALLAVIAFSAMAYTQAEGRHIKVDVLVTKLRKKTQLVLELVASSLALGFVALITWRSAVYAVEALETGEHLTVLYSVPLFPFKVIVPIGAFLFALQILVSIVSLIRNLKRGRQG